MNKNVILCNSKLLRKKWHYKKCSLTISIQDVHTHVCVQGPILIYEMRAKVVYELEMVWFEDHWYLKLMFYFCQSNSKPSSICTVRLYGTNSGQHLLLDCVTFYIV